MFMKPDITMKTLTLGNRVIIDRNNNMKLNNLRVRGNLQATGGISSGSVPIWIGQTDVDAATGTLTLADGLYKLRESIVGSIILNEATLDMSSQTISYGPAASSFGVKMVNDNSVVCDGTISGFLAGIFADEITGVSIRNVTVKNSILPSFVPNVAAAETKDVASPRKTTLAPSATKVPMTNPFATRAARKVPHTNVAAPAVKNPVTTKLYTASDAKLAARAAHLATNGPRVQKVKEITPRVTAVAATPLTFTPHAKQQRASWRTKRQDVQKYVRASTPHIVDNVPHAAVYIGGCTNVVLSGVTCLDSAEVGILLDNCGVFTLQDCSCTGGNRGISIWFSEVGTLNNVSVAYNNDTSDWETSAALDMVQCYDVKAFNVAVTNNTKGQYAEPFDGNSGIMSLNQCQDCYFTDCQVTDNAGVSLPESYPTFSALLLLNNANCKFKDCNFDSNFRNNTDSDGGYIHNCALQYNTSIVFEGCSSSSIFCYNAKDSEAIGWLCVANADLTFKNCNSNVNYLDGSLFGSEVSGFIFVNVVGLCVDDCKSMGNNNISNDSSGTVVSMGIYDGCDGAQVKNFFFDGNDVGCYDDNIGIDLVDNYDVKLIGCSGNELRSYNGHAIGIWIRDTYSAMVDGFIGSGMDGYDFSGGVMVSDCSYASVKNCKSDGNYSDDSWSFGFATLWNVRQAVFQNNHAFNNSDYGFYDNAYDANSWFANVGGYNDWNFNLYGDGNTYVFYINNVSGNPWSGPGWGSPPTPSVWDNIDCQYD